MSNKKPESQETLNNKKVKIKVENFYEAKDKLSNQFLNFLRESKDVVFTAKLDKKYPNGVLYTLKENDLWLFYEDDLEVVK